MAANTSPIFGRTPQIEWGSAAITAANTAKDGTGTVTTVFTADATEGSTVSKITFRAAGTNVATVARVFLNNGSTNATAANNVLKYEITLPATTLSEVAAQPDYTINANIHIQAGYKLNVVLGTAVSAGYYVSAEGAKF